VNKQRAERGEGPQPGTHRRRHFPSKADPLGVEPGRLAEFDKERRVGERRLDYVVFDRQITADDELDRIETIILD